MSGPLDDAPLIDAMVVERALERIGGGGSRVASHRRVAGGCIASGSRVTLADGRSFFVKRSRSLPPAIFAAEAVGLAELVGESGPRVPRVLAVWSGPGEGFIVMEWIEPGSRGAGFGREFGRRLAALHREKTGERFGFETDNYIGSTPQPNGFLDCWVDFFRERRLRYQTKLARDAELLDDSDAADIESILNRLDELLREPDRPSLLHGDLWGGNYLVDAEGMPTLIDPAVYYGHREAWPLEPGYDERSSLYNLYHILNHANIFGGSYVSSARAIVRRYR